MSDTILDKAMELVHGERQTNYGHPLDNHTRTAKFWSTYLGINVTVEDVCMLNILQKIARSMNLLRLEELEDIAGYAANIEMAWQEALKRETEPF